MNELLSNRCWRNSLIVMLSFAGLFGGCATRQSCARTCCGQSTCVMNAQIPQLLSSPAKFAHCPVRVTGILVNRGKNYFTDLAVYLLDKDEKKIPVRIWLPLEVPPGPPGEERNRPAVLGDFLGRKVTLEAYLRKAEKGQFPDAGYYLEVQAASIVESDSGQTR